MQCVSLTCSFKAIQEKGIVVINFTEYKQDRVQISTAKIKSELHLHVQCYLEVFLRNKNTDVIKLHQCENQT